MTAPLPAVVRQIVDGLAADYGTDRSTILTDIVCQHYARHDLMRRLPQQVLFTENRRGTGELSDLDRNGGPRPHVKVRPPAPVAALIEADADRLGIERCTLLADIVCQRTGFPELVRQLDQVIKEGLPLAM